jgi:hypothetical protein
MQHYFIELAFWILLAFFIGCFLGGFARMRFGAAEVRVKTAPVPVTEPVTASLPSRAAKIAKPKKPAAAKAKPAKRAAKK